MSASRSRSGLLQWLSILASIAFVAWMLVTRREDLAKAMSLTPSLFVLISVSALTTFLVNGLELQILAGGFGNRIPFKDAFLLGLMVSTLNYLPMKSGTMLNGVILKVRYRVRFADFAALVTGSTVVHLWVALVLAGSSLAFAGDPGLGLALAGVPSAGVLGLVVWGRLRKARRPDEHDSRAIRFLGRATDGLGRVLASPRLLALEIVVNVVLVLLASVRTMWAFEALSVQASFSVALVVTSVSIFAARMSVIPGGLGFKEGGAAAGSAMAGIDTGIGLAASVVDRAVTLVWLLFLGVPAALYLQRTTGIHLAEARSMGTEGGGG